MIDVDRGVVMVTHRHLDAGAAPATVGTNRTAALLARDVAADAVLLLAREDRGYPAASHARGARRLDCTSRRVQSAETSVHHPWQTKIDAACQFIASGGLFAGLGAIDDAAAILAGTAGTLVSPGPRIPSVQPATPPAAVARAAYPNRYWG